MPPNRHISAVCALGYYSVYMTCPVLQAFQSLPAELCQQLAGSMTHVHLPAGHNETYFLLLHLYCCGHNQNAGRNVCTDARAVAARLCMQCCDACSAAVPAVLLCMQCQCACSVNMHALLLCMQCCYACSVTVHAVLLCMQCCCCFADVVCPPVVLKQAQSSAVLFEISPPNMTTLP